MAKLADIHVYSRSGGVEFDHRFPCYVDSEGVFSVITEGYDAELRALAKVTDGVQCCQDRQKRWRLESTNKKALEAALRGFADDMLNGETETRLLIFFDPNVRGTVTKTDNNQFTPFVFGDAETRVDFGEQEYSGRREDLTARPEVALVRVTRTKTKSGQVSYKTVRLDKNVADMDDEINQAGRNLANWSNRYIGEDNWRQIKDHLYPYSDGLADHINLMMERLAGLGFDLAQIRDAEYAPLFSEKAST